MDAAQNPDPLPSPAQPVITAPAPRKDNSQIGGVSLRGLMALLLILTVCVSSVMKVPVAESLTFLANTVVAFYFGHQVGITQQK